MLDGLRADLRLAFRSIRTSRIYALSSIVTLGIGVAAPTTIFCVVQTVMLQALPYRAPEQLVMLWESSPSRHLPRVGTTPPHLKDWQEQSRAFLGFAAVQGRRFVLSAPAEEPERVAGSQVSSNYFELLGVPIARGRALAVSDSQAPTVTVLSHGLWIRRFGADPEIVGKKISLDGTPFTVVGVAGPSYNLFAQLWVPLRIPPDLLADRQAHMLSVVARLRPGVALGAAASDMAAIVERQAKTFAEDRNWTVLTVPILDQTIGNVRPALLTLGVAVALLLLIACVNVSGLALTRGRARGREIAIRAALGASRGRVAGQLATESMVLLVVSLVLAAGLTFVAIGVIRAKAPPSIPRIADLHVGLSAFLFALAVAAFSVATAVVLPAVQAARADLVNDLRDRSSSGTARHRAREILLVSQIGFAIILLSASAVLIRRFVALKSFDIGVRDAGVLVAQVTLPRSRYREPAQQAGFVADVLQRVGQLPGVRTAAAASSLPGGNGAPIYLFSIRGRAEPDPSAAPASYYVTVTPGYFGALSIPIVRGRGFTDADRENANPVALVDQALAHRYFGDANPIGEHVYVVGDSLPHEIVGVVANVREGGVAGEDHPVLYVPLAQIPSPEVAIALKTAGNAPGAARELRGTIREMDPQVALLDVGSYTDRIASFIAPDSFYAGIALGFSSIALLLCAVGLYGVVAFDVARQRREIGIRMALGASTVRVRREVIAGAMKLVVTGVVVGAVAAFATQNVVRRLFADVSSDALGLALACAALLVAGLCAGIVPAFRASRVDPLVAIRAD